MPSNLAPGRCHRSLAAGMLARHHRATRPRHTRPPLFGFPVANGHSVVYHRSRKGVMNDPAGLMEGFDH
jgi:hypothetical protein